MDNLTMEMRDCEKAGFGVSYGKWKATQPYRTKPKEMQKQLPHLEEGRTRECVFCKRVFEYHREDKVYCSRKCIALAKYYRDKEARQNEAKEAGHD